MSQDGPWRGAPAAQQYSRMALVDLDQLEHDVTFQLTRRVVKPFFCMRPRVTEKHARYHGGRVFEYKYDSDSPAAAGFIFPQAGMKIHRPKKKDGLGVT